MGSGIRRRLPAQNNAPAAARLRLRGLSRARVQSPAGLAASPQARGQTGRTLRPEYRLSAAQPSVARGAPGEWPEHSAPRLGRNASADAGRARRGCRCGGKGGRLSSQTPPGRGEALAERRHSFRIPARSQGVLSVSSSHSWLAPITPLTILIHARPARRRSRRPGEHGNNRSPNP